MEIMKILWNMGMLFGFLCIFDEMKKTRTAIWSRVVVVARPHLWFEIHLWKKGWWYFEGIWGGTVPGRGTTTTTTTTQDLWPSDPQRAQGWNTPFVPPSDIYHNPPPYSGIGGRDIYIYIYICIYIVFNKNLWVAFSSPKYLLNTL